MTAVYGGLGVSMSSVNSAYGSSSRITGMFSNMDTDTLVENMTSTQQSRIDKQEQKKQNMNGTTTR
jgi:hypothetical protein